MALTKTTAIAKSLRRVTQSRNSAPKGKSITFEPSAKHHALLEKWSNEQNISRTHLLTRIIEHECERRVQTMPVVQRTVTVSETKLIELGNTVLELGFVLQKMQVRVTGGRKDKASELFYDALERLKDIKAGLPCT